MMIRTGGPAPNQKSGRQEWPTVLTKARAKTVASR